jgi:SAM-dependent methyltransferase
MTRLESWAKRILRRRTAEERWNERWGDPSFHPAPRIDEIAHHCLLAGYARTLRPGGRLLDAGCGDGEFRPFLTPDAFSRYVGIDFAEPIARAQQYADARTTFEVCDIREYVPAEKFDTIAFNESLFYIDDAVGELDRYTAFLNPDGVFLVSLHRKPKTDDLWDRIAAHFDIIDQVRLISRRRTEWIAGCFRPRR